MDSPLVTAYLISVGILLMGAGYTAVLAWHSKTPRVLWSYTALCLCFALFQLGNALQYSADDMAAALHAHRWLNLWSLLAVPLGTLFFESVGSPRPRLRLTAAASALTLVLAVHNFSTPFGYRFTESPGADLVELPWGESIYLFSGTTDLPFQLLRLLSLLLLVASLPQLRDVQGQARLWRTASRWGAALLVAGAVMAVLVDSGRAHLPYASGFFFLLVSVLVVGALMRDLRRQGLRARPYGSGLRYGPPTAPAPLEAAAAPRPAAPARTAPAGDSRYTDLPDRAQLLRELAPVLQAHQRRAEPLTVFVFDIDRFDLLCATQGRAAGDSLLAQLTGRLQKALVDGDLLSRGHEAGFAVVCKGLAPQAVAQRHAQLDHAFALPVAFAGKVMNVRASAGVARFPDDGLTAEAVLDAAELALHEAKTSGRGSRPLKTFTTALKDQVQEQLELEDELRTALERGEFVLHYQPQIHGDTGQLVCMEALVRWQHPVRGLVSPLRFIPVAESTGLIHPLGAWVLDTACAQLARWHAQGHTSLRMAVNLSGHQLEDESLEATIADALARHRIHPGDLELEITESVLMHQLDLVAARLAALRTLGVRLSIDDFGTGYSSLSYLRRLPVHAFKLDRSFIRDMDLSGRGQAVCATAIGLAFDLQLEVVAEGVETLQQAQMLKQWGCHLLQGFLFARPMPADAATEFLQSAASAATAPDLAPAQQLQQTPQERSAAALQMAGS